MRRSDRGRRAAAALGSGILSAALTWTVAPAAWADALPASIRACAQETDSLKRLICFDKEVARYNDQPVAGGSAAGAAGGREMRPGAAVPKAPPVSPAQAAAEASGPAQAASAAATLPAQPAASAADLPRHITARVVSVENFPDAVVVHLDNGQVWQQIQEATASVNFRAGDTVSIDREMSAYWLSGKDGAAVKVRQKIRK